MTTASSTEVHRWRAFALLAVSFFMTIVDVTIVNVALPTIGRELDFSCGPSGHRNGISQDIGMGGPSASADVEGASGHHRRRC